MPDLTLFTIPKGFTDRRVALIQRNALASWRRLAPVAEVLVLGDDPGVAEAAHEFGATHVGDSKRNEFGTPLLDWAFRVAAERGSGELLCYVNADIILLDDFVDAALRLPRDPYLAIGRRWNCDISEPLDFRDGDAGLRDWALRNGTLDNGRGSDYFVFRRSFDFVLPAFAVGRPGWDNWMIGRALRLRLPVIDMTASVLAIHQNHDYVHVPSAQGSDWEGPEAVRNRALAGDFDRFIHSPFNATHLLMPGGLRRARSKEHMRAKLEAFVALRQVARPLHKLIGLLRRKGLLPRSAA